MTNHYEIVFGPDVAQVLPHLEEVTKDLGNYRYLFVPEAEMERFCRPADGLGEEARIALGTEFMNIYARELVYRAHYAALTSLRKTHRWIQGMISAVEDENILAFVSTFRGLLECAADATDVLSKIPVTLSENHERFTTAIQSKASSVWACPDLENELIHYSHARKPDKTNPQLHHAKTMRSYLDSLATHGVPLVHDCYSELCEMTHPGALGVHWFFHDENGVWTFADDRDLEVIAYLTQKYKSMFSPMLCYCVNALLTLRVINAFGIQELIVEAVNRWDFGNNKNWSKMKSVMPNLDSRSIIPRISRAHQLAGLQEQGTGKAGVKMGRNDPCSCNSGKKFKNCCMRRDEIW